MTCRHCMRRLSEHIDGTLDGRSRVRVEEHLARCSSCAAAQREMVEALRLLREASDARPPDGLADGILLKLASARQPSAGSVRARRRGGAWMRAAAAAGIVLAVLAGLLAWHGRSVAGRVAELESDLSGLRERLESERAGLARTLERVTEELQAARAATERTEVALRSQAARREQLEAAAGAEADRAARMAEELRAESGRAAALELEVALLREQVRWGAGDSAGSGPVASLGRPESEPVIFRRRGGRLELETRGLPHVFVPRLFALARDESDPELANLALSSLEGILGTGESASGSGDDPEPLDGVGPVKWVRRGVAVFTSATGLERAPIEDAPPDETARERRLRGLEGVWRQAAGAEG